MRDADLTKQLEKGTKLVIHLAAIPSVSLYQNQVYNSHSINMGGTTALIEAVRDNAPDAPVIYASTAALYGSCDQLPLAETSPTTPLGFYGLD